MTAPGAVPSVSEEFTGPVEPFEYTRDYACWACRHVSLGVSIRSGEEFACPLCGGTLASYIPTYTGPTGPEEVTHETESERAQ